MKIFEFNKDVYIILVFIMLSSFASTGLIYIINTALIESLSGRHTFHMKLFVLNILLLLTFKRIALRKNRRFLEKKIAAIRTLISDHLINTNLLQIEQLDRIDLYIKMTTDVKKISKASEIMIHITHAAMTFVCCLLYILCISIISFVIISCIIGLSFIIKINHSKTLLPDIDESINAETALYQIFDHILFGFKELKINKQKSDDLNLNAYHPILEKVKKIRIKVDFHLSLFMTFLESLTFFFLGVVIFTLNVKMHVQIQLINVFLFLLPAVYTIVSFYPYLSRAIVSAKRLESLFSKLKKFENKKILSGKKYHIPDQIHSLSISNLCFNYTDKNGDVTYSMGPINFSIKQGETLFITGGNGSGKSTLLKLMTGLYPPLKGTIKINNQAVMMHQQNHIFSGVFSDYHLFDRLYGLSTIDIEEVNKWLQIMKLNHRVVWDNNKFSYADLSSGEKRRLAFIISMLEDKPVYIFDEWTSDQDPKFTNFFYQSILKDFKKNNKTAIVVTHDERYFHCADKILTMKFGKGRMSLRVSRNLGYRSISS